MASGRPGTKSRAVMPDHYLDIATRSSGSFGGWSPLVSKVLLSNGDVIGGFRSEWAHFVPFLQRRRNFWALFIKPSDLLRLLARIGEIPITCLNALDLEEYEKL